jgi:hypothetical protein
MQTLIERQWRVRLAFAHQPSMASLNALAQTIPRTVANAQATGSRNAALRRFAATPDARARAPACAMFIGARC